MNPFYQKIAQFFSFCALLLVCLFSAPAQAQTNDLMIVEYVDWNPGDGFAMEIYNPTSQPISLSNYYLKIFNNGNTTPTSSTQLTGTIAPCGTITAGNFSNCTLNLNLNISGVNGDDVVALTLGNTTNFVDMVGLYGSGGTTTVDNVSNALKWHRLTRNASNTIRYTATNGTSANSWPALSSVNVTGWTVTGVSCITPGHSLAGLTFSIGADTTICSGATLTLDAKIPGSTYLWSTGATTRSIQVSSSGTYSVQVNNGCASGSASRQITVLPALQLSAGKNMVVCGNSTATLQATAANFSSFQWSGGNGAFRDRNNPNTTYVFGPQDSDAVELTAVASNTCTTATSKLIVYRNDSVKVSRQIAFTPQNPVANQEVVFSASHQSRLLVNRWVFPGGVISSSAMPVHRFAQAGDYPVKLIGTNKTGCIDSVEILVRIARQPEVETIIPNVFTPGNDGFNDTFKPQLPPTVSYELNIYNRYGNLVFESRSQEKAWDGRNVSAGVYFAHLKAVYVSGEKFDKKLPVTVVK